MGKPKQTYRCSCKSTLQADTIEQLHEMVRKHFTIEEHNGHPIPSLEGLAPNRATEIVEEHPDTPEQVKGTPVHAPFVERKPLPSGVIERRSHILKIISKGAIN